MIQSGFGLIESCWVVNCKSVLLSSELDMWKLRQKLWQKWWNGDKDESGSNPNQGCLETWGWAGVRSGGGGRDSKVKFFEYFSPSLAAGSNICVSAECRTLVVETLVEDWLPREGTTGRIVFMFNNLDNTKQLYLCYQTTVFMFTYQTIVLVSSTNCIFIINQLYLCYILIVCVLSTNCICIIK